MNKKTILPITSTFWKKGQWLKGMGLSGSQAEYILACCGRIEADARREVLTEIHDKFCELAIQGKNDEQELKGICLYDRTLKLLAILRKEIDPTS